MRLIGLAVALVFSLALAPRTTDAQRVVKVPVLGILNDGFPSSEAERQRSPFLAQLRELGWHEGHTITLERRYAEGNFERLPALAAELVRLPVDVIVTFGTPAARAAKQATSTIPIIITSGVEDPVALGLVASLARPGKCHGVSNRRLRGDG
jgi:putative ABC transport system substrate-binding protein